VIKAIDFMVLISLMIRCMDMPATTDSTPMRIEKVELADGNYLTNSDIDSLVQQINAYVTENDLDIDSNNDIKQNEQLNTSLLFKRINRIK